MEKGHIAPGPQAVKRSDQGRDLQDNGFWVFDILLRRKTGQDSAGHLRVHAFGEIDTAELFCQH
jgi:hypothetical protein